MGKAEKRIRAWLENPPTEAPVGQVEAVLKTYFLGRYEKKRGSHIVVRHEGLKGVHNFGPDGDFEIPVKGGQKIKKVYLKRLLKAVRIIEELGGE